MEEGFLYIATKEKYLKEAIQSLKTARKAGINLPAAIFVSEGLVEKAKHFFSIVNVIDRPAYSYLDKIKPLSFSPFKKTIFLDSDTKIYEDISDLLKILSRYDLAFAYSIIRNFYKINDVPDWFLEPNTGVIVYRQSEEMLNFFREWEKFYVFQLKSGNPPHDQSSFRWALYKSDLNFYVLGEEYNLRTIFPFLVTRYNSIKIFHDRFPLKLTDQLYLKSNSKAKPGLYVLPQIFIPRLQNLLRDIFIWNNGKIKNPDLLDFLKYGIIYLRITHFVRAILKVLIQSKLVKFVRSIK